MAFATLLSTSRNGLVFSLKDETRPVLPEESMPLREGCPFWAHLEADRVRFASQRITPCSIKDIASVLQLRLLCLVFQIREWLKAADAHTTAPLYT